MTKAARQSPEKTTTASNMPDATALGAATRLLDDAWEEVRRSPWVRQQLGEPLDRLPDLSLKEAERRAQVGRELLQRFEALEIDALPPEIALSLRLVRHRASTWSREAEWYWTVVDPVGVGFFGLFLPTAYCAGFLINFIHSQLAAFRFDEAGDLDRYLALCADYARLIGQIAERTRGQAERGIRMPKVQVHQARVLITALRGRARENLIVRSERLAPLESEAFKRELELRIERSVEPAFDRVLAVLSDHYLSEAPDTVGMAQYSCGAQIYSELVKLHTTLDLTPQEVHSRGLERLARIEAQMDAIRRELGFADARSFTEHLQADTRFRADTIEGVKEVFQRYIGRLKPRFQEFFRTEPATGYTIAPLPEALQGSMTFGYYDAPRPDRAQGVYFFNAANLTRQSLFNVGALTYHELVPGHHLHLSTQQANRSLHPFRSYSFFNAYNEGWAEYAATLAGEIGMYETPEERYGRLVMDAFLTCRLVVDTGMNVLDWSLDRARQFLREHSGMAEAEICSETIRYSCDIPAQSLAYKLGDTEILALRERMRAALGAHFDIRDFHAAVLEPGGVPLPELAWHIEREIERLKKRVLPDRTAWLTETRHD